MAKVKTMERFEPASSASLESTTSQEVARQLVEGICEEIEDAEIFDVFDTSLLERVAWVESRHGLDHGNPDGGIWRVRRGMFFDTQMSDFHPDLPKYIRRIRKAFGIRWTALKWEQIQQPLHSALAAGLLMSMNAFCMPSLRRLKMTVRAQAKFWRECYFSTERKKIGAVRLKKYFISKVNETENRRGFIPFVVRLHSRDTSSKPASLSMEMARILPASGAEKSRKRTISSDLQTEVIARTSPEAMPIKSADWSTKDPATHSYATQTICNKEMTLMARIVGMIREAMASAAEMMAAMMEEDDDIDLGEIPTDPEEMERIVFSTAAIG